MTKAQDEGFKKTLRRMLSTPPTPHTTGASRVKKPKASAVKKQKRRTKTERD